MATFKPVSRNIATTPENVAQYLAYLEELSKLRRPSDVAMGFGTDRTPMAFALPQTRAVSQVVPGTQLQTPVLPSSSVQPVYQTPAVTPTVAPQQLPQTQGKTTSYKDFKKLTESAKSPKIQTVTQDGGVRLDNGQTFYQDGTWRENDQAPRTQAPTVVKQMANGYAIYSDGKVRYAGEQTVSPTTGRTVSGIQAIQDALFSKGGLRESVYYPGTSINQYFGANKNNPKYGYGPLGHRGVDIASNVDQPITMPFKGKVVQVLRDDGTRWGSYSGHQGFGNSILIQLDNGSYIRMSHLNRVDVIPGQEVGNNMVIGLTGNTGNSDGPHTDIMTYDQRMGVIDPDIFTAEMQQFETQSGKPTPKIGEEMQPDQMDNLTRMRVDEYQRTGQIREVNKPQEELQQDLSAFARGLAELTKEPRQTSIVGDILATGAETIGRERNIPGVGASELFRGDVLGARQELGQTIATGAKQAGIKTDIGFSEFIQDRLGEAKSKFQQALGQPNIKQMATDVRTIASKGLDIVSKLDFAKGLAGTILPVAQKGADIVSKTAVEGVKGIIPQAFAQDKKTPIEQMGGKPVGQKGFSGEVLTSGVAPSAPITTATPTIQTQMSTQQSTQQSTSKAPVKTTYGTTFLSKPQVSTQTSSQSKSISQPKPTQQKSTIEKKSTTTSKPNTPETTQTQQKQVSKPALQPKSQAKPSNPYSGTKTIYGVSKPQEQKKSEAKPTLKPAPKPAPKQSTFKKVVSKVKSFFKKK